MRWRRYNAAIAPIALQIAPANRPLHASNMHSMHTTRTTTTGYYYYSSMNTYSSNMHTIPPRTRTVSILYSMCILSTTRSNNNTSSYIMYGSYAYYVLYIHTQNESTYSPLSSSTYSVSPNSYSARKRSHLRLVLL